MSIKYGNYIFDEPVSVSNWMPPYRAAIYAVLVPDSTIGPRPFRVIYFGESGNLSERGFIKSHHKFLCWLVQAGAEGNLYIAILPLANSTPEQRRSIESQLIEGYRPVCNLT